MWNNKTKKEKKFGTWEIEYYCMLFILWFVFLYMRMEMLTLSLNIETIPSSPKWFCISLWEIYFLFFDSYSGDRTALVQLKLSLNGFKTYIQIINKWYNAWTDYWSSSCTTQTNFMLEKILSFFTHRHVVLNSYGFFVCETQPMFCRRAEAWFASR